MTRPMMRDIKPGDVQIAVRARSRVGEGPVWDAATGQVHWVDILSGQVHTSDLGDGTTTTVTVPTWVGAAVPMLGGGFVAATREGFAQIVDGELGAVDAFLPEGIRMNDAKCDPAGRFVAGSCAEDFARGAGALHRLEADWTHSVVLEGLTQPNGLGWSPDGHTFYLVDTQDLAVHAHTYDLGTGELSDQRVLARFDVEADGYPDGLAVDVEGCLWIAMWAGSSVLRISPEGERVGRIDLPVPQTTSCAFTGPGLRSLCITSAAESLTLDDDASDGSVFTVSDIGVAGVPVATFAGSAR